MDKLYKLTIILIFFTLVSFSQEKEIREITSYPNSVVQLNWGYNSFVDVPADLEISSMSTGVDIYALHTLFGRESFVSLAAGGGFSVQNIKSNSYFVNSDSSYFQALPKDLDYSKNKVTTVFVDIPIELRFRSRPKPRDKAGIVRKRNFRFAIGFKLGYNIQKYIKYDGQDYRSHNYGNQVKFKEYNLKNILPYRYGIYSRIGIGNFSLYAYYALTDYFEKEKGPVLRLFSIGLSINI